MIIVSIDLKRLEVGVDCTRQYFLLSSNHTSQLRNLNSTCETWVQEVHDEVDPRSGSTLKQKIESLPSSFGHDEDNLEPSSKHGPDPLSDIAVSKWTGRVAGQSVRYY